VPASHSRAVLSSAPVRTVLPSGLKATERTGPAWVRDGPICSPATALHSRTTPAVHPVRIVLPSGLKAAAVTAAGCGSGWPSGRPAASPRRTVLSSEAVRIVLPSRLKATAVTLPACARGRPIGRPEYPVAVGLSHSLPACARGRPIGRPVTASQSCAVLSALPVRIVLPSGLKTAVRTSSSCWEAMRSGGKAPAPCPETGPDGAVEVVGPVGDHL